MLIVHTGQSRKRLTILLVMKNVVFSSKAKPHCILKYGADFFLFCSNPLYEFKLKPDSYHTFPIQEISTKKYRVMFQNIIFSKYNLQTTSISQSNVNLLYFKQDHIFYANIFCLHKSFSNFLLESSEISFPENNDFERAFNSNW